MRIRRIEPRLRVIEGVENLVPKRLCTTEVRNAVDSVDKR